MKILYLCHRIPYPPNKGEKIRAFHQVRHLSETNVIDLVCLADNPGEERYSSDLERWCRRVFVQPINPNMAKVRGLSSLALGGTVSVGYFYRSKVQRVVDQWLTETDYDAIVCFSSTMAEYVFRSWSMKLSAPGPRLIMDFCDLDSDKWGQYARESRFPLDQLFSIEGKRLLKFEKKINCRFDHSLFVAEKEAELFNALYPEARNVSVISNGVDHTFFSPDAVGVGNLNGEKGDGPLLLFTGAMDYHANVDAVSWFCREIFPAIRQELPDARFCIVGSKPTSAVKELGKTGGVAVTGFVEDIRPYYKAADVSVIPLRLGRGIQNKVLEAMAMGKPVVTTAKANAGIQAQSGEHLWVEDSAAGFAQAVTTLWRDREQQRQLGASARRFVTNRFDWAVSMRQFAELLNG